MPKAKVDLVWENRKDAVRQALKDGIDLPSVVTIYGQDTVKAALSEPPPLELIVLHGWDEFRFHWRTDIKPFIKEKYDTFVFYGLILFALMGFVLCFFTGK